MSNRKVIPALPRESQLDLDSPRAVQRFRSRFAVLRHRLKLYGLPIPRYKLWRSNHHWHAKVTWPRELSDPERIALAAVLGSDPIRELLSLVRHFAGSCYPQLLFEYPEGKQHEQGKAKTHHSV